MRFLLALLFCSTAMAADQPQIVAPDTVEAGDLIVAKVESDTLTAAWIPVQPMDLDFRVYGSELVASSGTHAGQIIFMCSVIDWENQQQQFHRIIVNVTGDEKDDDDDGDDDDDDEDDDDDDDDDDEDGPPAGPRNVIVLHESEDQTTAFMLTTRGVQEYCAEAGHKYLRVDDDQTSKLATEAKAAADAANVDVPALIVSAEHNGQTYTAVTPLPSTAEEAIAFIKEAGG